MELGSSLLTTHMLDKASGLRAQGLCLHLSRREDCGQQWTELKQSCTDLDDRCPGLLPPGQIKKLACKLSFDTEGYWQKRGQESFYPYMEVTFTITNENHKFHGLPLLSPWSYTTYRGSLQLTGSQPVTLDMVATQITPPPPMPDVHEVTWNLLQCLTVGPRGQNLTSLAQALPVHLSGLRTQRAQQTHRRKCPVERKPLGCAGAPGLLPGVLSEAPRLGGTPAEHS
ncbi:5-hydroxyisourate hydrolase-like [Bubalus bubalis]|uniref:5-hydroxyisourate hydrolase-like n=1 Tax=Bubalus bubalis TaxID=89462 RepID=UPI00042CDE56|nr:5-hydroxyisourate hydrolase-like [Bubalus bubalis]